MFFFTDRKVMFELIDFASRSKLSFLFMWVYDISSGHLHLEHPQNSFPVDHLPDINTYPKSNYIEYLNGKLFINAR